MYKRTSQSQQYASRTGSAATIPAVRHVQGAERASADPLATLEEQYARLVEERTRADRHSIIARDKLRFAKRAGGAGHFLPHERFSNLLRQAEAAKLRCTELGQQIAHLKPQVKALRAARRDREQQERAHNQAATAWCFLEVARRRLSPASFDALMDEALLLAAAQDHVVQGD